MSTYNFKLKVTLNERKVDYNDQPNLCLLLILKIETECVQHMYLILSKAEIPLVHNANIECDKKWKTWN